MVHLLGGERGMAPSLTECARALQKELVPVSWVHPNRQPLGHTLHSWVTGNDNNKKKNDQLFYSAFQLLYSAFETKGVLKTPCVYLLAM